MKNVITNTMLIASILTQHNTYTFHAFSAQQQAQIYQAQRNIGLTPQTTTTTTTPTNCPPTTCANGGANYYLMPFQILLSNQAGATINTHSLNVPTTFALSSIILVVHIFPQSNMINNSSITYATDSEGTYIVSYVIKDPSGSVIYKEFDQNLTLKNIPHQITLAVSQQQMEAQQQQQQQNAQQQQQPTGQGTPQPGTFTTSTIGTIQNALAQSSFIPPLSATALTQANRQQILNGISPLSQQFLLSIDTSGNITATPISGTFDADNTSATTLALANNPLSATTDATGAAIGSFTIQFNDTTLLTFENKTKVQFTQNDLAQGILLNVVIYPSESQGNYPVVATLRSSDGLKFRKKAALPPPATGTATPATPLTAMPTNITIQYAAASGSGTPQSLLTTSFLNSQMTSNNNAFTIISPINLRFMITQNSTSQKFNVVMM